MTRMTVVQETPEAAATRDTARSSADRPVTMPATNLLVRRDRSGISSVV
jgi:hypothetical protein